ncbi:recombinase family protein [Micropruina sp.]|uniref:recombinase family protein n=1 Tax=Micropruina sp. TaxID=2737536 RepID=UPI00344C0A4C
MFRIVSALAEIGRDLIAERTESALDAKRRRGERVGAQSRNTLLSKFSAQGTCSTTAT